MKDINRFHRYVMEEPNTGCWLWTRPLRNGYGLFSIKKKTISAHRFSFEHYNGPLNGLNVCHRCDTPSCVNPAHLFLGTHKENMNDRDKKGRCQRGRAHYAAKFTEEDIMIIREASKNGFSNPAIGRYFNTNRNVIWLIVHNLRWKHI